jgi:hypothetical protein
MLDLPASIRDYYDNMAEPVDASEVVASIDRRQSFPNWAVAVGAAVAVFILIGGVVWLIGGTGSGVIDEPTPVSTTPPTTTAPTPGPEAAPLITIDADQINYPHPGDETHGVAVSDGMLWASTELGIIRWDLARTNADLFTSSDGLPFADGSSGRIAAAPDGMVWAFTWNQDLARFDGTGWSEPAGYDQLDIVNPRCRAYEECLNPITAMAVGPDGLLSLAVGPETLLQYDGIDWTVLPIADGETHGDGASAWSTDMAVASDGTLWAAAWEELLAFDGDSWDRFTANDGLPSGGINSVAVAPNGDVWIGTTDDFEGDPSGGVARFDGESWTVFDETDGLHEMSVSALTVGPDGTVWTVHRDTSDLGNGGEPATGGISRFDGATWSATTVANEGIPLDWGGAAVVDDAGTLWITSSWGVIGFDGAEATVLRFPNGTRPPIVVVPDAWDPILATTKAKAAPPAATCPPGSDPNSPGIVGQERPDPGYAGNQAAAFDRHTGRIVYVDAANETWTFDVCTNTWQQMNPTGSPERYPGGVLVYDADSDRVISLRSTSSSVYDPNTNTWTPISDREAMPGDHPTGSWIVNGAVYDPVSGLVLAQHDQLGIDLTVLSAYDVDTDRWTRVGPLEDQAWRNLIGYAPQTDRLIFAGYGRSGGSGGSIGDDTGDRHYFDGPPLVVDPRTGTATATEQGASIMGGYTVISYAAGTDTALVQTWPDNQICWFDPRSLTWDNCLEADYPPDVEGQGFGPMVGDPINNRLVFINPGWNPDSDESLPVWAVDLDTGEWTQLLAPPTP